MQCISDNQVITVDGTMETLPADDTMENMQTTEFLQSSLVMCSSTNGEQVNMH